MLDRFRSHTQTVHDSSEAMRKASINLTLPILAKHYPRTFARMIHTTYSADDEYQPDFEDDEGELYWPSQFITGSGIGWLCHMGRGMVREFGRDFGYMGQEGLLSKDDEAGPAPEDERSPYTTSMPLPSERR